MHGVVPPQYCGSVRPCSAPSGRRARTDSGSARVCVFAVAVGDRRMRPQRRLLRVGCRTVRPVPRRGRGAEVQHTARLPAAADQPHAPVARLAHLQLGSDSLPRYRRSVGRSVGPAVRRSNDRTRTRRACARALGRTHARRTHALYGRAHCLVRTANCRVRFPQSAALITSVRGSPQRAGTASARFAVAGLRIAPPEAPVTGYMFGKGLYFAECAAAPPRVGAGCAALRCAARRHCGRMLGAVQYTMRLLGVCSAGCAAWRRRARTTAARRASATRGFSSSGPSVRPIPPVAM